MKYIALLCALFSLLPAMLQAQEEEVMDSLAQFPYIIFVGQVVDITPHAITVQNTMIPTPLNTDQLLQIKTRFADSKDLAGQAFGQALKLVSLSNNGHMQLNFFVDNVNYLFHQDANTYIQFLPLFHLYKNNIKELALTKDLVDKINALEFTKFVTLPLAQKIMKNAWFAGVFKIHPESKRLVYYDSRYFPTYDDLLTDEMAQEFNIRKIVESGLAVTVSVVTITGNESKWAKDAKKSGSGATGGGSGAGSGNGKKTPSGGAVRDVN